MTACLTQPWTSAPEVDTIGLRNLDDSEEPIMMRNVSGLFRHVREQIAMLLALIVDAVSNVNWDCLLSNLPLQQRH
jgi:hypothetical protein